MEWLRKTFTGSSFWYIIAGISIFNWIFVPTSFGEVIFFIALATAEILTALKQKPDILPK